MKVSVGKLLEIFAAFFRVGAFTFGGGLAMLPLFEREVIEKKGWVNREDILDIYAVSQSIPGIIAVNSSIFIGHRIAGIPGAIAALAGIMAPSLIIILAIATFFTQVRENPYVASALRGIRAAVAALIFLAAYKIARATIKDWLVLLMACVSFAIAIFTDINVIYIILSGALLGWLLHVGKAVNQADGKSGGSSR